MEETTKTCGSCHKPKPLSQFSKQANTKDGLKYRCKDCDKRYFDAYYAKKAPQIIETVKKWQEKNAVIVASHKKRYQEKIQAQEKL